MYRISLLLKDGNIISYNEETKDKCEEFLIMQMDKYEIKKSIIVNQENINERYVENF